MQVTLKANCWDGMRTKGLTKPIEIMPEKETILVRMENKANRHYESMAITMTGIATAVAFSTANLFLPMSALAAPAAVPVMASDTASKLMHVFDPLIRLVVSLSYPIAGVMIAGGCLMIMVQQREAGMKMLQNAAIGYILVQLSPTLLQLLVGVGGGL